MQSHLPLNMVFIVILNLHMLLEPHQTTYLSNISVQIMDVYLKCLCYSRDSYASVVNNLSREVDNCKVVYIIELSLSLF